jgi:hypothetical protein
VAVNDLVPREKTLAAAGMRGTHDPMAQIDHGLTPACMIPACMIDVLYLSWQSFLRQKPLHGAACCRSQATQIFGLKLDAV